MKTSLLLSILGSVAAAGLVTTLVSVQSTDSPETRAILFVHGLGDDGSDWGRRGFLDALSPDERVYFAGDFSLSGNTSIVLDTGNANTPTQQDDFPIYTISFTDGGTGNIRQSGEELSRVVEILKTRHPGARISLVGFSLGGIISREYLTTCTEGEVGDISQLITISSPHSGSELALIPHCWRQWKGMPPADPSTAPEQVKLPSLVNEYQARAVEAFAAGLPFPLDSEGAAMLVPPDLGGAYLAELNSRPHPDSVKYVSILTEKNLMTVTLRDMIAWSEQDSQLAERLKWVVLDWMRSGIRLTYDVNAPDDFMNGDGAVSLLSQDLNQIPAFSETPLEARIYRIDGAHSEQNLSSELTALLLAR